MFLVEIKSDYFTKLFRTTIETSLSGILAYSDVTLQRQHELALQDREAHLRRVIDHMLGFVGVLDIDGTLTEANQTALTVGGVTREEVIGRKFWDCS